MGWEVLSQLEFCQHRTDHWIPRCGCCRVLRVEFLQVGLRSNQVSQVVTALEKLDQHVGPRTYPISARSPDSRSHHSWDRETNPSPLCCPWTQPSQASQVWSLILYTYLFKFLTWFCKPPDSKGKVSQPPHSPFQFEFPWVKYALCPKAKGRGQLSNRKA